MTRFTVEMPDGLYELFSKCAEEKDFTKSQFMRMALEVLALLSRHPEAQIFLVGKDGEKTEMLIPGVSNVE